jgi:hypothetical protein
MAAGSIGSISNDLMRAKNAKAKAFGGRPINRNIGWLEFSRYYQVKAQICRMQVAALLLIGLAAVLTLLKHAPNEPAYQGRRISYWFAQYVQKTSRFSEATNAILHLGDQASPYLARVIEKSVSPWRRDYNAIWRLLPESIAGRLPAPI